MLARISGRIISFCIAFFLIQYLVWAQGEDPYFEDNRQKMVAEQIIARGLKDEGVLAAMRKVPRHKFVPDDLKIFAYLDRPLPIGHGQTISQPYIVALMTELAGLKPEYKVLEIGTGSGYQAAVLAELVAEVYTIEILKPLADESRQRLESLGYDNIHVKCADGYLGWQEHAPYDAIIVTAAPEEVPPVLIEQLKEGGHLVIPVGSFYQELKLIVKTVSGIEEKSVIPVRFVPMIKSEESKKR
ncbi:MAG: protein-L-isoaspartate(D-aspartate) O-methyltransferase [Candidatus Omnitrophica bacterium]|nr:protein-L-isoaspartate(D-aspartate) O-methyltransferase [Candidatus Omnitrophota bacterium]